MAKLKDGFYKLTASSIGSDLLVLLAGGGAKPIADFALADGTNATGTWSINISGNANTATTATTASKLSTVSKKAWGLTYWTSGGIPTDISGDMTGVGNITIASNGNVDRFITFDTTSTRNWRIGYLGTGSGDANYLIFQSTKTLTAADGWHDMLKIGCETGNAILTGLLTAKNFVSGAGINDFTAGTVKLDVLNIPTSNGGTTFGPGSNGQVLKSNGTTVYWASDSNSNTWTAQYNLNTWSRILSIKDYASVLVTIEFGGSNEASLHTYLISTGYNSARIVLLGNNGFSNYYNALLRVTYSSASLYYLEIYHTYNYGGNPDVSSCRFTKLSELGTVTPITTVTAGGGTVASSLTSSNTVAMNFKAEFASYADNSDKLDGFHWGDFVRNIEGTDFNPGDKVGNYFGMSTQSGLNTNWYHILSMNWTNNITSIATDGSNATWQTLLALPTLGRRTIHYRTFNESSPLGWVALLDSNNYTSYCAPASHSHAYYPLSGNTNMSGDNVWIGSTMGGGTDYWRIGGSGTSDNGVCQITIGDNSNDYFQIVIADYTGTNYTALLVKAGGTYAPHFYESSDQRLKTNIQTILNKDNIPQIKEFDWKESGEHSYGLIAQELEEQGYSELVSTKDDGYKTVNYSAALSLIVGKLQVKIKELEKEIKELKKWLI